jgi:hypothetical protein
MGNDADNDKQSHKRLGGRVALADTLSLPSARCPAMTRL